VKDRKLRQALESVGVITGEIYPRSSVRDLPDRLQEIKDQIRLIENYLDVELEPQVPRRLRKKLAI
jgi:hypothetical protein